MRARRCPRGQWELVEPVRGCGRPRHQAPAEQPGKERAERDGSGGGCESEPRRGSGSGVSPRGGRGPSAPTQGCRAAAWAERLRTGQRLDRGLAEGELRELGGTGDEEGTGAAGGDGRGGSETVAGRRQRQAGGCGVRK